MIDYRIKEILEGYAAKPKSYNIEVVARDITNIIRSTCPHCGCDMVSLKEMLDETHDVEMCREIKGALKLCENPEFIEGGEKE